LNLDAVPRRSPALDPDALRKRVISALGIRERLNAGTPLYPRTLREQHEAGVHTDSIFFCSEPGIMVSGCLLRRAAEPARKVSLRLVAGGTRQIESEVSHFLSSTSDDEDVFVFDVRGTGTVSAQPVNPHADTFPMTFFNTEAWFAWCAYCLGESLLGMRVFDVMRGVDYLRDEAGYAGIRLDAAGLEPSLWGYLAAALDTRIAEANFDDLIESFEAIVRTELYRKDFKPAMLVHGVLREFDLPDLRPLFAGRVLITQQEFI
jgi:hypothetical protein